MIKRIQLRRDSAVDWEAVNPILAEGEVGINIDTYHFKIGNGVDPWLDLEYFTAEAEITKEGIEAVLTGEITSHIHDGRYYTETETGNLLTDKVDKVTGSSLVIDTEIAKIHALHADDQDLSGKISHSLATAANDFLVASGSGAFVKKTLTETKSVLSLGTISTKGFWSGTAAEYTALGTWDNNTLYFTTT